MYDQFYGLSGRPFQLTPDPHFYFESGTHRKAMSYLGYGLAQGEGFIVITGDIGAGKTTLVGHLMNSIDPNRLTAVKLVSTAVSGEALLQLVAEQFGLEWEGQGKAELLRGIEQFLREQARAGRRTLLIVDEGQNLPIDALEELRMLSNFQLGGHSLLQIFLLGQPEFRHTLFQTPTLEQLRQRVIATHHLDPMEPEEVEPYILHRLGKVGWQGNPSFSSDAFELLFDHSDGVPRRLNVLVSRLLLFGAVEGLTRITGAHVRSVVAEMSADGGFNQPVEAAPAAAASPVTPAFAPVAFAEQAPEPVVAAPFAAAPFAFAAAEAAEHEPEAAPAPVAEVEETSSLQWPPVGSAAAPEAEPAMAPQPFASSLGLVEAVPSPAAAEPDPMTADPLNADIPPFAPPPSAGLGRFSAIAIEEPAELLPLPTSSNFFEARSLVANHMAPAAQTAAPFTQPSAGAEPAPFAAPVAEAPQVSAPFGVRAAAAMMAQAEQADDAHQSSEALSIAVVEVPAMPTAPFAGIAHSPEPVSGSAQEFDDAAIIGLQRQLAGLEARIADQDAALRRVLDLLIDWVERDPAGAPASAREWAA